MSSIKAVCENRRCGWHGPHTDPFDLSDTLQGCPKCKGVECIALACEVEGCWHPATYGTPTKDGGYAQTCGAHRPKE